MARVSVYNVSMERLSNRHPDVERRAFTLDRFSKAGLFTRAIVLAALAVFLSFWFLPAHAGVNEDELSPDFAQYDFTLKSLDGKTKIQLGGLIEENYVVLVFWSSGCPICDFAMPYVAIYQDTLIEKEIDDVKLITVALDARAKAPLERALAEKYAFEILHDPMGRDTKEAYLLEKKGIPACYVFNKQGYIITTVYGFEKKFVNAVQDAINADRQSQGGARSRPNIIIEDK